MRNHALAGKLDSTKRTADDAVDMMSTGKSRRGFASMEPERVKEVAAMGGRAAQAKGRAHQLTLEESRRGGSTAGAAVARDAAYMAEIGRRGGLARQKAARRRDRSSTTD